MRPSPEARAAIAGVLIAALVAAVYFETVRLLVHQWNANDVYSYAYLVPVISALLIWLKRDDVRRHAGTPALVWGAAGLAAGLVALQLGRLSGTNVVQELSLVLSLAGLALLLFGWRAFGVLLFPLVYLLAMVPVWEFATGRLHPIFQLYSATLGVNALKLLGYPVVRQGVFIELPRITLEVAEACSGINYLISVLCIGIPLTILFIRGWTKRTAIVAAAVVIALLSNGLRVAIVALFAYYEVRGPNGDVHGPFALFRSLLISGIGYAVLFALVFRFADKSPFPAVSDDATAPPPLKIPLLPVSVAFVLLAGCLAFTALHRIDPIPLRAGLKVLPASMGEWQAQTVASFGSDLAALDFDDRLTQNYGARDGSEVNVFMGYYQRQSQGRELAGYGVRTLFKGRHLTSYSAPDGRRIKDSVVTHAGQTFYVAYWYAVNGRTVSEDYLAKLYTAWDSLVRRRSNGGIVMVTMKTPKDEPLELTRQRAGTVVAEMTRVSKTYFPD